MAESTTMPPRGPTSSPDDLASSSRGLIPAENTTTCASTRVPSGLRSPVTRPSSSATTSCTPAPACTLSPSPSMCDLSTEPPPSSTWRGMSQGLISTMCALSPSARSASAASRPSRPPPTTTPSTASLAATLIASRSSIVR